MSIALDGAPEFLGGLARDLLRVFQDSNVGRHRGAA
jgi:hypothetical protein